MGVWKIYHKDGTILKDANGNNIDIRNLEYSDAWMGECYLTVTFRHETPIVFMMGDYIIYRNEKFVLNYEPGKDKKARINTCGDGFVYDSVKFNSLQNELSDAEFLDVVLNDNELHYTVLPKFQFYVETLDDLLDRIQANLNEQIGAGEWKIFSRNKDRSEQRGCTADEWNAAYGEGTDDNVIDSMSVTADSMTCWDALALVNSKWNVNFIVRGRNVYVGTAGVTIGHMFEYGRGNGLYEIEQNADSEQKVITRLRAYGSEKNLPSHYYADISDNLPNNMAINRLMLPGFPSMSLNDYYNSLSKEDKVYVNPKGEKYIFSTDKYRPYVDSANISKIGLHSSSQFFDTDDKTNGIIEIYPTLEEMVIGGVRVDEINEGVAPADNGRFEDGQNVANVDIYLSPNIDFDITGLKQSDFSISMKDGMCGGRTFTVAATNKVGNRWRLTIERVKDSALDLWFPYQDYPIKAGDHFVLTGITLPDSYVKAASLKLLKYAIALLEKNDYTRYVYQPKVDEIFMARQHDAAIADETGAIKSLHDTLKAGDLMDFRDDDLNISGTITIDQLNIKEQDGKIPTYEITLREDKEVGTIQKIQQQITSLESGNGGSGGGGGITLTQVKGQVATEGSKVFLSKLTDDTANGKITFIKGLIAKGLADLMMGAKFGNNAMITKLGEAVFSAIRSLDYDNAAEQGFSVEKEKNGKYHAFFTNLTIWGKAIFHELEMRKLSYSGGNIYLSGAGSKLIKVVPVKKLVSAGGVTSWVETTEDDTECVGWKCYLLADNGTTATMNDWQEGDQARCQTMGEIVAGGAYSDVSNKSYWRTIPGGGVSTQNEKIYGTKTETYLDEDGNEQTKEVQVELYDGQAFAWIVVGKHCNDIDGYDDEFSVGYNGSNPAPLETRDIPAEGDTIVLDGNRHRNEHGEYDKTDRQNVIILETTGEYAPRIACYANITEYKHTFTKSVNGSDKEVSLSVFETSPKGGTKINSSRFEWISDDGSTINIINYRGDWVEKTIYHKNDLVNHNNAVWVCVANSGVDVTDEPLDSSSNWKKVLSGGKGEKGDKGEDGLSGNGIVPVYTRSEDTPVPPTSADKNNLDNGWSLTIPSVGDVENVSYGDSSWADYNDDSGCTWKKSPTTAANSISSCLVTFTTTQANQVVKFIIKSFSEPRYDYVFLSEIDAGSVPSRPTSNGRSRAVSGNGVELSVTDIIATAGTHTVYVCYGKDGSGNYHGDYGLFRIESVAGIPLWQSNGKEVFTREDSGATKSKIESWSEPFKVTGEDGKDAVSYAVTLTRGNNGVTQGLHVGVTRYIGTACTTGTIISFGMSCKAYTDGTLAEGLTDRLQTADNYIDFSAFPEAKSFTVELLDKNGNKVATGNYSSGADAISILVEDAPLVFDTDDNGIVPVSVTKTAKVKVMKGNTNVTNDCTSESSRDDLSSNCMSSVKKDKDNECINVSIQGNWISKNDVIVDGVNQGQVSATSGYAVAQFVYAGVVYFAQVPFSVNVAKFTGVVAFNNKQYESKFTEITNKFGKDLADAESRITQTAREISLSVSEKSVGRRNLLAGSAFNRQEGFGLNLDANTKGYGILMNDGVDDINCIKVASYYDGTRYQYCGVFWGGGWTDKNIRIKHGTKYTLSCWVKVDTPNAFVALEILYEKAESGSNRDNGPSGGYFTIKEVNKWQLIKRSFTTDNTHNWIEANVYTCSSTKGQTFVAWFCKPMLEEGDYNGWTLSTEDYDYIGGNMFDNTLSLDKSGNLYDVNGTLTPAGFGESTSIYKSFTYELKGTVYDRSQLPSSGNVYGDMYYVGNDETCYRYNGSKFENVGNDYYYEVLSWRKSDEKPFGLEANKDYVFSFMAKGTGKLSVYFYNPDTNVFVESSLGVTENNVNGQANFHLTSDWKKYWVHWRPSDSSHKYVLLRLNRTIQSSAGDAPITDCYIAQPKLEVGAVVTEYTERKSDLVDKASLKAAGIEITSDQVTLYGNKVQVKNPKANPSEGYDEAAMFQNGKLNAQFINAGEVVAKGIKAQELEAQNLNVTGNSRLGIFEIHKAAEDERDEYTVNGDSIKYSGSYKFPDGKTEASGAGSFLTYKPMFIRQGAPDGYEYMRLGHQFTEWDDGNISGGSKNYFFVGAAARYVCSGDKASCTRNVLPVALKYNSDITPAAYIYSVLAKDSAAFAIYTKAVGTVGERLALQTNGAIRGVEALNIEIIYRSQQISSGIGAARCVNTAEITIRLPINPVVGQKFYVLQEDTGKVNITGDSNHQIILLNKSIVTTCNSNTKGQISIFIWSGNYWFGSFLTGIL